MVEVASLLVFALLFVGGGWAFACYFSYSLLPELIQYVKSDNLPARYMLYATLPVLHSYHSSNSNIDVTR
jgi:hypothetical protein